MIENYGDVTALSILVGLMVWYFKHTTKRQAEREDKHDVERAIREENRDKEQADERNYYRNLIDGGMRKNVALNIKGITLTKEMIKDFKSHNGHAKEFSEKMIKTLNEICNRAFGERRKGNVKVKLDRRK